MASRLCRRLVSRSLTHLSKVNLVQCRMCPCSRLRLLVFTQQVRRCYTAHARLWPLETKLFLATRHFHSSGFLRAAGVSRINMPPLTPTMKSGEIVEWSKGEGDPIAPGEVLCKIKTGNSTISLLAIEEGILAKILAPEKTTDILIGAPICLVVDLGEEWQNVTLPLDQESSIGDGETQQQPLLDIATIASHPNKLSVQIPPTHRTALRKPKGRRGKSLDRSFITPLRAMTDYLVRLEDLNGIRRTMRRSPHSDEPPITVFWRRDVEAKSLEIWGSVEGLNEEKAKREAEAEEYDEAVFTMKRILKNYRAQAKAESKLEARFKDRESKEKRRYREQKLHSEQQSRKLWSGSGKVVLTAVAINFSNFVIKLVAWLLTGSHSLFAEAIHSLADTINQLILAYGIHKSTQQANLEHPYGYSHMRHVASLISGVGIFCVGSGLSIYHGITGLISLEHIESLYWAFYVLAGSLVSEGATLYIALNAARKRAAEAKMGLREYIYRGVDPSLSVVILEDTAAVMGVGVAAVCMGITAYTGNPLADALGSLLIGGLLGVVASVIIYTNSAALVGRSISRDKLARISASLESDIMVRAIHDVKGIDMGNSQIRYKAEVDFDGRELTRNYLDRHDVHRMLLEIKSVNTTDDFESFFLHHGEAIVDSLGAEIDRIELRLMAAHPEIRHCDLEIL